MLATRLWQNTAKVHFDATAARGRPAADLRRPRHQPGPGAVLQRPRQRAGDRRRSTPAPTPTPASPATPSAPGPRCSTRRRPPRPASARCGCARSRPRRGRRPSRCATRRASTCPMCCSISTTGCWSRFDAARALHFRRRLVAIGSGTDPAQLGAISVRRREAEGSMADVNRGNRPLSPFMIGPIYRPQINSIMSICHRLTGLGLALGGDARGLVVPGRGDRPRLLRLRRRAAHLVDRRAGPDRLARGALVPLLQRHPAPGLGRRRRARASQIRSQRHRRAGRGRR